MKIVKCLVSDIGAKYRKSAMTETVRDAYRSYVETHFKFLAEHCQYKSHLKKERHHLYLLTSEETDSIEGFRYFYFPVDGDCCELFATFIDPRQRKKGFASEMVNKSIEYSNSKNIFHFIVRMSIERTAERDGLFSFYKILCSNICPPNMFTVYYAGKEYKFGL